jgi:hypothetical protein
MFAHKARLSAMSVAVWQPFIASDNYYAAPQRQIMEEKV